MNTAAINRIANCRQCRLCECQRPLLDTPRLAEVLWVGLSAVKVDDVETTRPLAADTRTGKLVEQIETRFTDMRFYRSNLVKCLPEKSGRIRYPSRSEMHCCFPNLLSEVDEVSPRVVLLLGRQVADYVLAQLDVPSYAMDPDFYYGVFLVEGVAYVPIHHPSYVLIYKRRKLAAYVQQICQIVSEYAATPARAGANNRIEHYADSAAAPSARRMSSVRGTYGN